jgi:hypothetical protein
MTDGRKAGNCPHRKQAAKHAARRPISPARAYYPAVGFFDQSQDDELLQRIESGGIPAASERRLQGLAGEGALFASALSVNEFALLDRIGPRPLAQVLGASVYKVGRQYLPALDPRLNSFRDSDLDSNEMEPGYDQKRTYRWHETVLCELDSRLAAGRA